MRGSDAERPLPLAPRKSDLAPSPAAALHPRFESPSPSQTARFAMATDNVNEHPLETPWTFWFDKKPTKGSTSSYVENLRNLVTVRTLEEFWGTYTHLLRADELPKDCNYHVFREGNLPMWESFPQGGCWIIRVRKDKDGSKKNPLLAKLWETLVGGGWLGPALMR